MCWSFLKVMTENMCKMMTNASLRLKYLHSFVCNKKCAAGCRNRLEGLQYRICTHVKLNTRVARDRALSKNLSISPPQLFCIVSIKLEAEHRSFGNSDGLNQVKLIDVTTGWQEEVETEKHGSEARVTEHRHWAGEATPAQADPRPICSCQPKTIRRLHHFKKHRN